MTFPIDILPPATQDAIRAQAELGNYPIDGVATAALAIMSYAAQGHYDVEDPSQHGRSYPCSEYYMVMVKSGDAKSAIYSKLMSSIYRWQDSEALAYEDELIDYRIAFDQYEKDRKSALKEAPDDSKKLVKALDKAKPKAPRHRRTILSKTTTNGIYSTFQGGWPSCGLFTDEGGSILAGHSMKAENNPVEFASALTMLFDKGSMDRTTGETAVHLAGKRLSCLIMVQPEVARGFINNREFQAQGIHARFNIVQPGAWEMLAEDFTDPTVLARRNGLARRLEAFSDRIGAMIGEALPLRLDRDWELEPETLGWTREAKTVAVEILRQCVKMRGEQEETYWKRLFEHFCRTAGILTAFEGLAAITPEIAEAAWSVVRFYADQWANVDVDVSTARQTENADLVEKTLKAIKARGSMSRRDLGRGPLQRIGERIKAEVLSTLIADEEIEMIEVMKGTIKSIIYQVRS